MLKRENQKPLIGAYLLLITDRKILLSKSKISALAGKYSLVAGYAEEGDLLLMPS